VNARVIFTSSAVEITFLSWLVCLAECQQNIEKNSKRIFIKFLYVVGLGSRNSQLSFWQMQGCISVGLFYWGQRVLSHWMMWLFPHREVRKNIISD